MSITIIKAREPSRFVQFCDFCGATEDEAKLLISGAGGSHICDECALECVQVIEDRRANNVTADKGPKP